MSDSIKKYHEMVEDGLIEDETFRFSSFNTPQPKKIENYIISEGDRKQAYQILTEFSKEAILEAARILKNGS
jgi:hypothetical protein